MAFTFIGQAQRLTVNDSGQTLAISGPAPQCRIFNAGPNDCRVNYENRAVLDTDPIMPVGLIEVHTKHGANTLNAKCATGQTCALEVVCGQGD